MNRVDRLCESFNRFITVPWREGAAAAQRVIFCIYNENDELKLRTKVAEFELATRKAGHEWFLFDLSDTFVDWLSGQRYAESYYKQPHLLATLLPKYLGHIAEEFASFLDEKGANANSVVALKGVGTLFGLLKVKQVMEELAPMVPGRLVVFFPGSFEDNNYRLLDGYDGWNYLAVPITADKEA